MKMISKNRNQREKKARLLAKEMQKVPALLIQRELMLGAVRLFYNNSSNLRKPNQRPSRECKKLLRKN